MAKKKTSKRVVIVSDLHCGHRAGLTPPGYQTPADIPDPAWQKFAVFQREMWSWYRREISRLQPVDILIVNGDAIDGKNERAGGRELMYADRGDQCDIALKCLRHINAKDTIMTYGTPYHGGNFEDWENEIADNLQADIGSHEWVDINGLIFDVKHFIPGSTVENARGNASGRANMWNRVWAERGNQPRGDIFIRSHVHYNVELKNTGKYMYITPALQGYATIYGARKCEGTVDIGFYSFDVEDKHTWSKTYHEFHPESLVAHARQL